jgi:hypothetical protein
MKENLSDQEGCQIFLSVVRMDTHQEGVGNGSGFPIHHTLINISPDQTHHITLLIFGNATPTPRLNLFKGILQQEFGDQFGSSLAAQEVESLERRVIFSDHIFTQSKFLGNNFSSRLRIRKSRWLRSQDTGIVPRESSRQVIGQNPCSKERRRSEAQACGGLLHVKIDQKEKGVGKVRGEKKEVGLKKKAKKEERWFKLPLSQFFF